VVVCRCDGSCVCVHACAYLFVYMLVHACLCTCLLVFMQVSHL